MDILGIIQLAVSVLLIITILLQQRGSGIGSAFGGDDTIYTTKRGIEKMIFRSTVVLVAIFLAVALIRVII